MIQYVKHEKEVNFTDLKQLYERVGWKKHTINILKEMYKDASFCIFAIDGNNVVGCARVLSDNYFNAAIYDLIVDPDYQKQGIGQAILTSIQSQFQHVSCIHLISTLGNEAFYQKCGFSRLKTGMAIYRNPELATDYLEQS